MRGIYCYSEIENSVLATTPFMPLDLLVLMLGVQRP